MTITIKEEILEKNNLTPDLYYFLYCKYHGVENRLFSKMSLYNAVMTYFDYLCMNNWITKDLQLTEKSTSLFLEEIPKNAKMKQWIDDWRYIFPEGIYSGGYSVRGDRQGCIKKMKKFLDKYPEYSIDNIFKATEIYVSRKEREQYRFMQLAHYFIEKDGISNLASVCEEVINGIEVKEEYNNDI